MQPHRRQPTRLPNPWDSPGKNTGVGCHFLLQCMKVKSESEVAQSCPTLSDPMDCSPPGSSISYSAKLLQSPSLNSLSHTANSHQLSILQMVMYVSMLLCPYIPHFPSSPLPHVYKSVLYVWSSLQELAVKFLQTSHRLPGDCSKVERKPCFVLLRDYRKELYQVRSSTSISFYHNIQT